MTHRVPPKGAIGMPLADPFGNSSKAPKLRRSPCGRVPVGECPWQNRWITMLYPPTPNSLHAGRQGLNSFDQHICEILRAFWICCTIKVILSYEPTTVKPIM